MTRPLFAKHRRYRIAMCPTRYSDQKFFCAEYRTWLTFRWKCCTGCFDTWQDAYNEALLVRNGLSDFEPFMDLPW
jgi:hypothetical protein